VLPSRNVTVPVADDGEIVAANVIGIAYIVGFDDEESATVELPGWTVKPTPPLDTPPTVTTTLPVVVPVGTTATIDVALQLVIAVAVVPLNFIVLVPCAAPKLVPVIATDVPTGPDAGDKLVMLGVGIKVKLTPLLWSPLSVTTTFPVDAPAGTGTTIDVPLQLVGVATVPLKVTAPEVPKLFPVMVADVPTGPEVGAMLVMLGGGTTVNGRELLLTWFWTTSIFPEPTPVGTVAVIWVALQITMDPYSPFPK
jgi:hypothetical protein